VDELSRRRLFAYALGTAGYFITDRIVVTIAVYFYLPPPGRGLESQISTEVFAGVFTVFGLAMLLGRIVDSIADPLVGHASDRSRSPLGRRRVFLIAGIVPMVLAPLLLFWPPAAPGHSWNAVWLAFWLMVYFTAFTVYVAPYLALIPELAETEEARVRLSRLLVLVGFPLGIGFGSTWALWYDGFLAIDLSPVTALRLVIVAGSLVAAVFCLAPILAVDERRFTRARPSDLSLRDAFGQTVRNRPFLIYLIAQLSMIFGLNMVQPVMPYLATVVLGRDEAYGAFIGIATFAGMLAALPLAVRAVSRFGPKRVMLASLVGFGAAMLLLGGVRSDVPGGAGDARNLWLVWVSALAMGPPLAGLQVVPHVLLSQLIDWDEVRTGANRAAMYYGMQGFLTKWMYGVSLWGLTFLLARFGNSPEVPWGVVLVGPVAGVACIVSGALFARYPEQEILAASRKTWTVG
jgi:GPH family glycoside/pentoside/hexuronide:cation symporter